MINNKKKFVYLNRIMSWMYKDNAVNLNESNCHMFIDDVKDCISPYSDYKNYGYTGIEFIGKECDIKKVTGILEKITRKKHISNVKLVGYALRQLTSSLLHNNGVTYYTYSFDGDQYFHQMDGAYIFDFFNIAVMGVSNSMRIRNNNHNFYNKVNNVFKLSMPPECGGVNSFKKLIFNLSACKDMPHEVMDIFGGNYVLYFNARNRNILKITSEWGWDLRGLAKEDLTESYKYYRKINFFIKMINLRGYLIEELNALLTSAGLDARIVIIEKYQKDYLKELQGKIINGEILNIELKGILGPV